MGKKVLLVEDEFNIRQNIKALLELEEFEVIDVVNGIEALSAIETQSFDLIISDIMMTAMNGIELLNLLRSKSGTKKIPVILLTAKPQREIIDFLKDGNTFYLAKPFSFDQLIFSVQEALH